jgi:hypothetical protein
MPPTTQPLSENTILTRYLLQPSSLPTNLPYNTFLTLLPSAARNNADLQPHLRRLYADLQSQRNLDLDTVRANIIRECARAGTVKAQLRRDLARELGGGYHNSEDAATQQDEKDTYFIEFKRESSVELGPSRKRKRGTTQAEDEDSDLEQDSATNASEDEEEAASNDPEEEVEQSDNQESERASSPNDDDEIPESPHDSASRQLSRQLLDSEPPVPRSDQGQLDTLLDHAFHGARGLALPSTAQITPVVRYHSQASLLSAMEAAVQALEKEIVQLEGESRVMMEGMKETVGGLSDLRYGSFGGRGSGGGPGGEEGGGLGEEVKEGLRGLRTMAERRVREL